MAGIFIYSIFILTHVLTYSGFAASLALVVILLPSVTRVVEEVLRVVPGGLREASLALGAPEWRTVWSVVLPTARSGVVTAVLLGVARIVGETAPLLFTAFGSQVDQRQSRSSTPQAALPVSIWSNFKESQPVTHRPGLPGRVRPDGDRAHPLRPGPVLQPDQGQEAEGRPERGRLHGPHVRTHPHGERRRLMTTDVTLPGPVDTWATAATAAQPSVGGAGELDAEGVCAWFSGRLVLELVDPDHGALAR